MREERHFLEPQPENKKREQREVSSVEEGLNLTLEHIRVKLGQTQSRPLIVFVNGETGSGKSSFSMSLENLLISQGINGVDIETDLYQDDRFSEAEFSEQKSAWEQGQSFTRHNLQTREDETVSNPDVVIVTGGGASFEHTGIKSDFNVVMLVKPIDRVARRITRDHIKQTDTKPNPEHFLRELSEPEDPSHDVLDRFETHKQEVAEFLRDANLVVRNFEPNRDLDLAIEDHTLHFTATHDGKRYDIVQPVSPERLARLKKIFDL